MLNFRFMKPTDQPKPPAKPVKSTMAIKPDHGHPAATGFHSDFESDTPQLFDGAGTPLAEAVERCNRALDELDKTLAPVEQHTPAEVAPVEQQAPAEVAPVDPLDPEPARAKLRPYERAVNDMLCQAGNLEITDEASNAKAVAMGNQAKKLAGDIDKARKKIIARPYQFTKAVNATAKPFSDTLKRIENTLKSKIRVWMNQQEQERRKREAEARRQQAELQAKLDADAAAANVEPVKLASPVIPETTTVARTEAGSASLRKHWTFDVEDIGQVPAEYLLIDRPKVNAAIKAGVRTIAGLRIFEDTTTVFRQ